MTTATLSDVYCEDHGIRHCTICEPPPWLFPRQASDEGVSEA